MKQQTLIRAVVTIVILVFAVGIWAEGAQFKWGWLDIYSYAVAIGIALLWLWDRFLWRIPLVQQLSFAPRDISGTWRGTVKSLWTDPQTETQPDPKTAYLVIRQTASTVSAILLTDEARSVSSLAYVGAADGTASLDYFYLGSPDLVREDRSRMHHGSCSLSITGLRPTRLRGRYWTDRESRGELDFTSRDSHKAEDYDEALRLFDVMEGPLE
jgi:hypothetical protein